MNNASTDGTTKFLNLFKSKNTNVDILSLVANTGGAGGFYAGLKYARSLTKIDWVVVSDDDSYPGMDALNKFKITSQKSTTTSLFASAVYYPDDSICMMNQPMLLTNIKGSFLHILKKKKITGMDLIAYEASHPTSITASSFVGLFIRHSALRESKVLPDPDFFLYWDDIAYCLDMKKKGYQINFLPDVKFIHDCPRHSKSLSGKKLYYMVRNGLRVIKRLPKTIIVLSLPIKLSAWFVQSVKTKSVCFFFKALRDL